MEISFENKERSTWRCVFEQDKRIRESLESVVPDVNEDIGRIASVQSSVLLKSKELTEHGAELSGEVQVALLYITEGEDAVSALALTKPFSLSYEFDGAGQDAFPVASLSVTNAEAKVLNPRKVAVTVEICGELWVYRQESCVVASYLPEGDWPGLYCRVDQAEATLIRSVSEKTFAIHEQFAFPTEKPEPSQLVSQQVRFRVDEVQQIGSRAIAKGRMELRVCYLSEGCAYPLYTRFSSSFSQIMDTGGEDCCAALAVVQQTSAYYDLIDTISGEKALDTEIHAVLQLVSRCRETVSAISDAYSNRMPLDFQPEQRSYPLASEMQTALIRGEERIELGEDCAELLSVSPSLSGLVNDREALRGSLGLDVIYRTESGALAAAKRNLELTGERLPEDSTLLHAQLQDLDLRPEGSGFRCRATAEVVYQEETALCLWAIPGLSLDEESGFDLGAFPGVTLVRVEDESLWDLAKGYHSSVALIQEANETGESLRGRMLLIPRE